jgi:hypothetical protein
MVVAARAGSRPMNTSSERLPRPKPRRATSVIAAHPITTHPIETFKPAGSSDEYIITWLRRVRCPSGRLYRLRIGCWRAQIRQPHLRGLAVDSAFANTVVYTRLRGQRLPDPAHLSRRTHASGRCRSACRLKMNAAHLLSSASSLGRGRGDGRQSTSARR